MNIGEQIKSFENKRAALAALLEEVMTKAAEEEPHTGCGRGRALRQHRSGNPSGGCAPEASA